MYTVYWQKVGKAYEIQRKKAFNAKQKLLAVFNYAQLVNKEKSGEIQFQGTKEHKQIE
jgi:hypothetical protein